MKIASLKIRNFRTLESVDLHFPSSYAAICGANDSGKTNVVRAIRSLMKEEPSARTVFADEEGLSLKDNYPKWKDTEPAKRGISFELDITLHRDRDAGLYQFVIKQLSLTSDGPTLDLKIAVTSRADRAEPSVTVHTGSKEYADINAQEVLKKLQSSRSILFHNSTQINPRFYYPGSSVAGHIREISGQHEPLVASMKKTLDRA